MSWDLLIVRDGAPPAGWPRVRSAIREAPNVHSNGDGDDDDDDGELTWGVGHQQIVISFTAEGIFVQYAKVGPVLQLLELLESLPASANTANTTGWRIVNCVDSSTYSRAEFARAFGPA